MENPLKCCLRFLTAKTLLFAAMCAVLSSCNTREKSAIAHLYAQNDSLVLANQWQAQQLDELNAFMEVLTETMDSIATEQGIILLSREEYENRSMTRKQLKQKLDDFSDFLLRQRARIEDLENQLKEKEDRTEIAKLHDIIAFLNEQLDEKDRTIEELKSSLEAKDARIGALRKDVETLAEQNQKLSTINERQQEALHTQTEMINEGYVRVGTKRELVRLGLVSGGLRPKLIASNIRPELFQQVDIREFTELEIPSGKVQIMTQMPEGAYQLNRYGNSSTLKVLDPTAFWSVSNYLVIMTK